MEHRTTIKPVELPSLQDVRLLKPDGDFSRFVARNVSPDVRRAALKTLFSDPHFHHIDGLDIYMGDYTQPSPLSPEMLAGLWHAKSTLFPRPLYEVEQEKTADTESASPARAAGLDDRATAAEVPVPAPEDGDEQEVDAAPGHDSDTEDACLPFNEHVNFSYERDSCWTELRKE